MSKDREELIEVISVAIYREYENRPLYAQAQMNCVLSNELTQVTLSAIEAAGFVLAPREPTDDMNRAGATDQSPNHATNTLDRMHGAVANIYRAMINAYSPKTSGVEGE